MDEFIEWIHAKGCLLDGVEMRRCDDGSGYGIFALRSFRANETIISVPPQLMITAGAIADQSKYKQILTRGRLEPFEMLVVFFLIEQPNTSEWTPYLNVLPRTFSTPTFMDSNLNANYLPASVRTLWSNQQRELKDMYEKICMRLILSPPPSWQQFLWAWHVVNTRCIYVENKAHPLIDNCNGDTIAVIPFVDMLNHSNDSQGFALWDNVNQRYKVIGTRQINEGDQVFVCYGGHSNERLWLEYGFTIPNNIYNRVNIEYDLLIALAKSVNLNFTDAHIQTVKQAALPCTIYASDAVPSFGLKANLRILQLRFDQLSRWSEIVYEQSETTTDDDKLVVSVLKRLREMLAKKMNAIPNDKYHWLWREQILLLDECIKNA